MIGMQNKVLMVSGLFSFCTINFVIGSANFAADLCAKEATLARATLFLCRSLYVFQWLDFLMLSIIGVSYRGAMTTSSVAALARIWRHIVVVIVCLLFRVIFVSMGSISLYLIVSSVLLIEYK